MCIPSALDGDAGEGEANLMQIKTRANKVLTGGEGSNKSN